MTCRECEGEYRHNKDERCTPKAIEIKSDQRPILFHRVSVPTTMGDDVTNPPVQGMYANVLLVYEANNHTYLYNSDRIFTQISWGPAGNDFNTLENRPKYDGEFMNGDTNIPDFTGAIDGLSEDLANETDERHENVSELSDRIDDEEDARIAGDSAIDADLAQEIADRVAGDSAINSAIDKVVVTDFSVNETPSTASIVLDGAKKNILTGATTTSSITLPVASSIQAGVMNTSTYNSVQTIAENVNALLSGSVAVSGLPASPTQAQLTTAWQTATGISTLINTAKILDQTNNKIWTYYSNISTWISSSASSTVTVNTATNTSKGIVQGDSGTDGKVFVESDGTMSLNGWDNIVDDVADNMANITSLQTEKVDKVAGKQLSTEDYTTAEKNKLAGIEAGAEVNDPNTVVDASYVHTDNNYTTAEKNKLADIPTLGTLATKDTVAVTDTTWSGFLNRIYPVGSIFISVSHSTASSVATALGGGTWVAWGTGRVPVGVDTSQTEFGTVEKTGGEKTHTLTTDEMPRHGHRELWVNDESGARGSYDSMPSVVGSPAAPGMTEWSSRNSGGDQPHNNLQPYITCYFWKRTS